MNDLNDSTIAQKKDPLLKQACKWLKDFINTFDYEPFAHTLQRIRAIAEAFVILKIRLITMKRYGQIFYKSR